MHSWHNVKVKKEEECYKKTLHCFKSNFQDIIKVKSITLSGDKCSMGIMLSTAVKYSLP